MCRGSDTEVQRQQWLLVQLTHRHLTSCHPRQRPYQGQSNSQSESTDIHRWQQDTWSVKLFTCITLQNQSYTAPLPVLYLDSRNDFWRAVIVQRLKYQPLYTVSTRSYSKWEQCEVKNMLLLRLSYIGFKLGLCEREDCCSTHCSTALQKWWAPSG